MAALCWSQKPTVDRDLALRVLVDRRLEFQQGMLAAYVDLKNAFDSVHRESLWSLLGLRGFPPGIIGLLSGLYTDTESVVKCGSEVSLPFPGVCWGETRMCPAPFLFNTCMDWILSRVIDCSSCGASISDSSRHIEGPRNSSLGDA
ncbi:uncharacterized protein LOC125037408 [Penaeus chinensis]|uniref:uncharacterized protein LOC125037408 n=1 Tax=Penaeus chinensis TaxID=139456 RepID=UPI001FB75958|nr:uncharacterized protein LOC125037408 [Penaeus chinensis]